MAMGIAKARRYRLGFHLSLFLIYDQPFWESFFGWFSNLRLT